MYDLTNRTTLSFLKCSKTSQLSSQDPQKMGTYDRYHSSSKAASSLRGSEGGRTHPKIPVSESCHKMVSVIVRCIQRKSVIMKPCFPPDDQQPSSGSLYL